MRGRGWFVAGVVIALWLAAATVVVIVGTGPHGVVQARDDIDPYPRRHQGHRLRRPAGGQAGCGGLPAPDPLPGRGRRRRPGRVQEDRQRLGLLLRPRRRPGLGLARARRPARRRGDGRPGAQLAAAHRRARQPERGRPADRHHVHHLEPPDLPGTRRRRPLGAVHRHQRSARHARALLVLGARGDPADELVERPRAAAVAAVQRARLSEHPRRAARCRRWWGTGTATAATPSASTTRPPDGSRSAAAVLSDDPIVTTPPIGPFGAVPVAGNWDGAGGDEVGVYEPWTASSTSTTCRRGGAAAAGVRLRRRPADRR